MFNNFPSIIFKNVSKKFFLQEDKTFKEALPSLLLGKPWAKEFSALNDISFEIKCGETVGIVGNNGAGKSTILKLIAGVTVPTEGAIKVNGNVAPLIELGAGFHQELSGLENIYLNAAILGMHKKEIDLVIDKIIDFSGLAGFIHQPLKRYSSGMYTRLGFAVAVCVNAPILLIDEVLAVGDVGFQKKCLNHLKKIKQRKDKIIIFVSHSEQSVKNFCERVILINQGRLLDDGPAKIVFDKYHQLNSEKF